MITARYLGTVDFMNGRAYAGGSELRDVVLLHVEADLVKPAGPRDSNGPQSQLRTASFSVLGALVPGWCGFKLRR